MDSLCVERDNHMSDCRLGDMFIVLSIQYKRVPYDCANSSRMCP